MAWPLWDLAGDLAVARGGGPVKTDPMDRLDGRTLRLRLAAILWIPCAFGAAAIGSGFGSPLAGWAALAFFVAGLWLFAVRGDRIWSGIRRR